MVKEAHDASECDFTPVREMIMETGAVACGAAPAENVPDTVTESYRQWLEKGYAAGMAYLDRYPEIRRDPRLLLEGARSVISIAYSYRQPETPQREGLPYVASYALGEDYHDALRRRLRPIAETLLTGYGAASRICIDSAPIHERYWAVRCGIGERCADGAIYVRGAGSEIFLAEIVTTQSFCRDDKRDYKTGVREGCRQCGKCRMICPSQAIMADGTIDSRRCLNYLTIEHRGEFTEEQRRILATAEGTTLFGCDRCLRGCPLNKHQPTTQIEGFRMRGIFRNLTADAILSMPPTDFSRHFKGSPLKRARLTGLRRNLEASATERPEKQ